MRRRYRWNPDSRKLEEITGQTREFAPLIMPDLPAYLSPVTGQLVDGRRARREDLARTHCRPYEGREQEQKEIARQEAYADQKLDAKAEEAAHRAWSEAPERVRRELRGK